MKSSTCVILITFLANLVQLNYGDELGVVVIEDIPNVDQQKQKAPLFPPSKKQTKQDESDDNEDGGETNANQVSQGVVNNLNNLVNGALNGGGLGGLLSGSANFIPSDETRNHVGGILSNVIGPIEAIFLNTAKVAGVFGDQTTTKASAIRKVPSTTKKPVPTTIAAPAEEDEEAEEGRA